MSKVPVLPGAFLTGLLWASCKIFRGTIRRACGRAEAVAALAARHRVEAADVREVVAAMCGAGWSSEGVLRAIRYAPNFQEFREQIGEKR